MSANINIRLRRARMWLAAAIAPAGATVHDQVGVLDDVLLSEICWGRVREAAGGRYFVDL